MHRKKYLSNQIPRHRNPKSISGIDTSESRKRSLHVLIKENSFIFSFIFTGIMLFIILSNLPVHYETNDEFRMITILSGNGGFPSSPDVYYLNPVLSHVLYMLYKSSPYFPWFGLFLYVVYYLGWALILSVIVRTNDRFSFVLTIPLLFYFFFFHSSYVNFTSASLFLSFGVFLCTGEYFIRNEAPIKNTRIYFILLAVCFYLSFLLRWKLVLYSLFLFLPTVVFIKKGQIRKVLPVLLLLGLVICLNMGFNHFVYLSHQTYYDFDKLRIEFHDTHRGDFHDGITPYALQKARWNYNDYLVFKRLWFMHDNYTFNTTSLKTFLRENNPRRNSAYYLDNTVSQIIKSYNRNKNKSILLLVSLLSIFIYRSRYLLRLDKVDCLKIAVSIGAIISSILFFMYYRFMPRVFGPLYVYLLSMSFLLFSIEKNSGNKIIQNNLLRYLSIIVAGSLMIYAFLIVPREIITNVHDLDQSAKFRTVINQTFNRIENINPASHPITILICAIPYGLRTDFIHPLMEYRDFPRVRIIPNGWSINSTYYEMALKNLNLRDGHDLLKWFIDRKDVLLMLNVADINHADHINKIVLSLKSYYLQHITPGMKLDFIPVYDFRNKEGLGLVFFQLRSQHD